MFRYNNNFLSHIRVLADIIAIISLRLFKFVACCNLNKVNVTDVCYIYICLRFLFLLHFLHLRTARCKTIRDQLILPLHSSRMFHARRRYSNLPDANFCRQDRRARFSLLGSSYAVPSTEF